MAALLGFVKNSLQNLWPSRSGMLNASQSLAEECAVQDYGALEPLPMKVETNM